MPATSAEQPRRKPGRPPKKLKLEAVATATPQVKRKPGRPPKRPKAADEDREPKQVVADVRPPVKDGGEGKRKPGRPPKKLQLAEAAAKPVKTNSTVAGQQSPAVSTGRTGSRGSHAGAEEATAAQAAPAAAPTAEQPQRKPGRPPKYKTAVIAVAQANHTLGRPPKFKTAVIAVAQAKRKPGRPPKKPKTAEEAEQKQEAAAAPTQLKRKPGRKRKSQAMEAEAEGGGEAAAEPPVKMRGQPKLGAAADGEEAPGLSGTGDGVPKSGKKRGRPAKRQKTEEGGAAASADGGAAPAPKRRGRPPKQASASAKSGQLDSPKRPRGRPRKHPLPATEPAGEPSGAKALDVPDGDVAPHASPEPKAEAGVVLEAAAQRAPPEGGDTQAPKRRGRPPKQVSADTATSGQADGPKRPRGRPRKHPLPATLLTGEAAAVPVLAAGAEAPATKRRGRPPKQASPRQ
ncbi:hypothetical protein GPECTOR_28g749 [Gonium pectorale]|uniref:Uncharacterized protein n=1 Tax=Gonium pectorale TaxID=33097 RepID=A0A150GES8_GONPE|nr:hypothetical protein GPECTOR_28g749 [Gonium pectorale]|eukprot:KXZ48342.1 hypothetical protein GPECTOR_28g749 [Gonium pectorale]